MFAPYRLIAIAALSTLILSGAVVPTPATAEDRIAHANVELLLTRMPEMKSVMTRLESFEKELTQQLEVKQNYAQQKLAEAQRAAAAGATEVELDEHRMILQDLDVEIQRQMAESGSRLAARQAELIEPIRLKMQETIARIAEQEGYTYVLNSVDGAGTSIVLFGPDDRNLTMVIAEALGVGDIGETPGPADATPDVTPEAGE